MAQIKSLVKAAKEGQLDVVKELIESGINCNSVSESGNPILHVAVAYNQIDVVKYLIDKNVDVNKCNSKEESALQVAAVFDCLEIFKLLVDNGADCNAADSSGNTSGHRAATKGRVEMIKYMLEKRKFKIDSRNKCGSTALHAAGYLGNLPLVELLLDNGANIKAADIAGHVVTHYAAGRGHRDVIQYLVEKKKVNINQRGSQTGVMPLHHAASFGDLDFVKYLISLGADCKALDSYGHSAVHYAGLLGHIDIVKFLIEEKNMKKSECNEAGGGLLHWFVGNPESQAALRMVKGGHDFRSIARLDKNAEVAALQDQIKLVKCLVGELKFDVNERDFDGMTPLHIACVHSDLELVKVLIDHGADIEALDAEGNSILFNAIIGSNEKTVAYLIDEKGMDVNEGNAFKGTPLQLACYIGDLKIVKVLLEKGADCNKHDLNGEAAAFTAGIYYHTDVLTYLLSQMDINRPSENGTLPVHLACEFGGVEIVKELISKGADYNAVDKEGNDCLHFAARSGNAKVVKYLIEEKKFPVNNCNKQKEIPLQIAIAGKHLEVVNILRTRSSSSAC